jgi:hypothetical protein
LGFLLGAYLLSFHMDTFSGNVINIGMYWDRLSALVGFFVIIDGTGRWKNLTWAAHVGYLGLWILWNLAQCVFMLEHLKTRFHSYYVLLGQWIMFLEQKFDSFY